MENIITKKIEKQITFFTFDKIDDYVIDSLIEFCKSTQQVVHCISIELINNKPHSIHITMVENREHRLKKGVYYYFRGCELESVDNPNDVNFW